APPYDWSPCPFYSHFFWRKPLNSGKQIGAQVPTDAFYAFGGFGQDVGDELVAAIEWQMSGVRVPLRPQQNSW
ncbi:hypothetical protein, partial [Ilumatobacter sp.]|uniref:hypothetical protein n=1 Tax=Ilumatobacter sp. TaxID=1967498 RepID=UPI0037526673